MILAVYGMPGPQGSKKFVGNDKKGRPLMVESSAKVKPWREAVKWAALQVRRLDPPLAGPVSIAITFTLPKPKSAPVRRVTYPSKKPDLDKLVRSTFDALTDAGVWLDDGQVIALRASKVFPNEAPDALDAPGAVIRLEELGT